MGVARISRRDFGRMLAGAVIVSLIALGLRLASFSHEPTWDELYHLLAARSWAETGTFAILDGEYVRAGLFTRLIAIVYSATDGNVDSVRLLCIAIGTALVFAVFLGVARIAGTRAAWVAALMLALMPGAVYLSQFIRFYSLHALLFWIASLALYTGMSDERPVRVRGVLLLLSAALFALAVHFQKTTFIGLAAVGAWLVTAALPLVRQAITRLSPGARRRLLLAAVPVAAVAGLLFAGPLAELVDGYRSASLWSTRTNAGYYVLRMRDQFGVFWVLFPLAAIHALAVNFRPALFGSVVFLVAIGLHSFAGMRSERYLFYAMPFFLTVWGISLAVVLPGLARLVRQWVGGIPFVAVAGAAAGRIGVLAVSLLVAWVTLLTPGTEMTVRLALDKPGLLQRYWFGFVTSWETAADEIRYLVAEADVFVTSQGHHAIYYIGDFDVEVSATGLSDFQSRGGGSNIDPRTGRPVIADSNALRAIVLCNKSGVIVVDERNWRNPIGVNDEIADFIETHLERVDVTRAARMIVYRWRDGDARLEEQRVRWRSASIGCPP